HENNHHNKAGESGKINSHRTRADLAKSEFIRGPEMSVPVIEPDSVGRPVIIAHVKIGKAVTVDVPETCGQSPVQWRTGQRFLFFIEKSAIGPRDLAEMAAPIIEIEEIRLAIFENLAICYDQPIAQRRRDGQLAIHHL